MTYVFGRAALLGASLLCANVVHTQLAAAVGVVVDGARGRPVPVNFSDGPLAGTLAS